jgi:twitching motility two-component system response regulator PilH
MVKKILLVDDQRRYRDEIAKILSRLPVKVIFAEDGLEGLTKFRKEKPDMVIIDAMLPKLHGYQLCRVIRGTASVEKNIPLFIITGLFTKSSDRHEAITKYGANEFFIKPFDPSEFVEKIKEYLSLK